MKCQGANIPKFPCFCLLQLLTFLPFILFSVYLQSVLYDITKCLYGANVNILEMMCFF